MKISKFEKIAIAIMLYLVTCFSVYSYFQRPARDSIQKIQQPLLNRACQTEIQQTCVQLCEQVNAVSSNEEHDLIQMGDMPIDITLEESSYAAANYVTLKAVVGGGWAFRRMGPDSIEHCQQSYQEGVAVVIVCKNRWKQVNVMLHYLIRLLQRQRLCYRLFVLEQRFPDEFNRGMMFNAGFVEALCRFKFRCIVFHDADLAPINDFNPYGCDSLTDTTAVHLGVALDDRNFTLRYKKLVGGVLKMSSQKFIQVNGFSNMYWGWGQEDDDLAVRLEANHIPFVHTVNRYARYHVVKHDPMPRDQVPVHRKLLKQAKSRILTDGLSSLDYTVIHVNETDLYTHIIVDLPVPER